MSLSSILRLMKGIGWRDWAPARQAGKSATSFDHQVRFYSNGRHAVMMVVERGTVVQVASAQRSDGHDPMAVLVPKAEAYLRAGVGVVYFGGVENYIDVILEGRTPRAMPEDEGAVYAKVVYPIGLEWPQLFCATKLSAEIVSLFTVFAARRIPVEVFDELSASLALMDTLRAEKALIADLSAMVILYEHCVYVVLYHENEVLSVAAIPLGSVGVAEPPNYGVVAEAIRDLLGRRKEFSPSPENLASVVVCDTTSVLGDAAWRSQCSDLLRGLFPRARINYWLPSDPGIGKVEVRSAVAESLRDFRQFPLPLLAFL